MEDDDDNYHPDSTGKLDLKYRGWTEVNQTVWTLHSLQHLDLSFNSLTSISPEIASLQFLVLFNCSCNKVHSLPDSIGTLQWLRIIKANGNELTTIPKEVGQLKALEELILTENQLTSLPQEISGCSALRSLLLQNNDLCRLPLSLATLSGHLRELDLSNNNHQLAKTIPSGVHKDVHSILWILSLQQEKRHCIDKLKRDVKVLQHGIVASEGELAEAREKIASLEEKKRQLQEDLESAKYFLVARSHARNFRRWVLKIWLETKRAFARHYVE